MVIFLTYFVLDLIEEVEVKKKLNLFSVLRPDGVFRRRLASVVRLDEGGDADAHLEVTV
jgi:hypothetical protein